MRDEHKVEPTHKTRLVSMNFLAGMLSSLAGRNVVAPLERVI